MKKADEMDLYISLKSARLSWIYAVMFLLIWTWWEFLKGGNYWLPFILLTSQGLVFWSSQLILRRMMAGKSEEQD